MNEKIRNILTACVRWVQFRLDTTRWFFDAPSFDYQPLPWIGIHAGGIRGKATVARWQTIKTHLTLQQRSLKDIGGCVGFFCISAAEEKGMYAILVDSNPQFIRIARYATPLDLRKKVLTLETEVNDTTSSLLPRTDVTLVLSIWHHWVFWYGLEKATKILKDLWESTEHTLIFESGEEETKEEFTLPYPQNVSAKEWLSDYLRKNLSDSSVEVIGAFSAGSYPHYKIKDHKRSLFKITRTA